MKKILLCLCLMLYMFSLIPEAGAVEKIKVYVFTKEDEEISGEAITYLESLQEKYQDYFEIEEIQVWDSNWKEDSNKRELADSVAKHFKEEIIGAPYIVIGSNYTFDEYYEELNQEIEDAIISEYENSDYQDLVAPARLKLEDKWKKEEIYAVSILLGVALISSTVVILARKNSKKNMDI